MAAISFRPARRSEAKPLVGLYSESGCGKTFSSLMLARGFVGPEGRIAMIETESGRGEAYADPQEYPEVAPYDVAPIRDDFSPQAYFDAIKAAEAANYDALIIDSASHEWEATGGVLDQAASNQAKGMKGVLVWQQPKIAHQRFFMLPLMQTSIPLVIVNLRARYPMEQVRKGGASEWVRSERLEPKQSDDILFELLIHGFIDHDHNLHLTRMSNRGMEGVFLDGKPITVETGRRLRAWAEQRRAEQPERAAKQHKSPSMPADEAPFVIAKQGGDSGCATIEDWKSRMLDGISRLAPHQAEALYRRNDPLMQRYKAEHPEEVATVEDAFAAKLGA